MRRATSVWPAATSVGMPVQPLLWRKWSQAGEIRIGFDSDERAEPEGKRTYFKPSPDT